MGLFGRKRTETTTPVAGTSMSGWILECGPKCGFMARTTDKKDLALAVQSHMKHMHKTTVTEAEALKDAKATTWVTPNN